MASLGKLTIELLGAKFTRSTDLIKKMDPYVCFECREFEWKSSTCEKGGKKPEWQGQTFEIDVKYLGDDIRFFAKDDDPGKDEKIGSGDSKLVPQPPLCQPHTFWNRPLNKTKRIGKKTVEI